MSFDGSPQSMVLSLGLAALIAWRVYKRIRRLVGRQRLSGPRPWFTVTLFPLLLVMLALGSIAHPLNLACLAAGAAVGVVLGLVGLRLTRFEATPQGLFYTPNAHLGIALSLLFIGRIVYRVAHLFLLSADAGAGMRPDDFARNPWTLLIFATLAAYYLSYAIGLLRWRARVGSTLS